MKFLLLGLSIALCLMSQRGACGETIRIANGEWPPYFLERLPYYGLGSRIVVEAFALEGIIVKFTFLPWKRGLIQAQEGAYDGAVGFEINHNREKDFYASETVWEAPWVFFHLKRLPFQWKDFGDLDAFRVGGTLEYMYTVKFLEAERSGLFRVERIGSDEQNFKKLVADRIDIFPQLIDVGYYQIRTLFAAETANRITHHPHSFGQHAEQLLLSKRIKRNARLVKIFNRGLRHLKESGQYERYFKELLERGPN